MRRGKYAPVINGIQILYFTAMAFFRCPGCDLRFKSLSDLYRRHYSKVHSDLVAHDLEELHSKATDEDSRALVWNLFFRALQAFSASTCGRVSIGKGVISSESAFVRAVWSVCGWRHTGFSRHRVEFTDLEEFASFLDSKPEDLRTPGVFAASIICNEKNPAIVTFEEETVRYGGGEVRYLLLVLCDSISTFAAVVLRSGTHELLRRRCCARRACVEVLGCDPFGAIFCTDGCGSQQV